MLTEIPATMPILFSGSITLRSFDDSDVEVVREAAADPLIPLITTVPTATDDAALSEWGLALSGVHRLELYVEPWNEGSWRAAERAGYQREGLLRSWELVGDDRRDMFIYSKLPSEGVAVE